MKLRNMNAEDLDELHEAALEELSQGRVTPSYLAEQTGESRQLMSSRLRDLVMGDHVKKVHTGLYELNKDPRDNEQ